MIDLNFIPKSRSDVQHQVIDGESVILDTSNGMIHQLNETASFIWQSCNGKNNVQNIVTMLMDSYSASENTANDDVIKVISNFKELELLDE